MNQPASRKIDFRKQRDFSAIFSDSFKFFKQNIKTLLSIVLMVIGPFALAAAGIQGYLQSQGVKAITLFNLSELIYWVNGEERNYYLNVSQFILSNFISLLTLTLISKFFIHYQQSSNPSTITIKEILSNLGKDVIRVFLNSLLLLIFGSITGVILLGIFQIPILNWILGILGFLILLPNVYYSISVSFYLVLRDKILFTEALKKTWKYMRGNYWSTWLTMVTSLLITGIIGSIFSLPYIILIVVQAFSKGAQLLTKTGVPTNNSIIYILLAMLAALGAHLIVPLFNVFCTLTYHSHEEEEEGTGLKSKIDEIGLNN